jgi:hypothetical protein
MSKKRGRRRAQFELTASKGSSAVAPASLGILPKGPVRPPAHEHFGAGIVVLILGLLLATAMSSALAKSIPGVLC